jgi:hypothetical protein
MAHSSDVHPVGVGVGVGVLPMTSLLTFYLKKEAWSSLKEKREAIDARQAEIWQVACLLSVPAETESFRSKYHAGVIPPLPENSGIVQPVEQLAESV